ncbi:oligosaccharide flippase family protein [Marinoscillum furvescens]|uniref:O-antigen/teichoic acid export membrane protein n=1 Tax=Marinoscillum furvescens DSM 4134 TaxID=1122208 RepID=A0A3D9L8M6_MARFU|nr:oligosaccharide flippase family protein [Marinoscillum furvescens]REE01636.1 O-antigen/teichoic acid export membrane protein [Marinoscillum furvescens DSM 4134]
MNSIVKNILRFASGSTLGGLFNFTAAFLVAKLVGPEKWGIWMIFNIILKFSPIFQLGASESIQRRLPIFIAQGEIETANHFQSNAYSFSWLMGGLLVLLFILFGPALLNIEAAYCYLFAPALLFNLVSYNIGILFRGQNRFKEVGLISFLSGFFSVISIFLAYKLSFLGFLIGQLIRYFLTLLVTQGINKAKINFGIKNHTLKNLISDGSPILLIVISNYLITLSDRLIIANLFDDISLGLYGLAYLLINPLILISGSVNSVLYTSFSAKYGKDKAFFNLKIILNYSQILVFFYTSVIGIIYILIPIITEEFLTDYKPGIDAARLLLIGHIFYFSGGIITNVYFTLNKQKKRLLIVLIALFLNVCFSLLILEYKFDILSVAVGSVLSFIFLFIGLLVGLNFLYPTFKWNEIKSILLFFFKTIVGVGMVVCAGFLDFHGGIVFSTFLKCILFIVCFLLYTYLINKSDIRRIFNESNIFGR